MQLKIVLISGLSALLCACSSLPSSGPTGGQIRSAIETPKVPQDQLGMTIVEVGDASALPVSGRAATPLTTLPPPPTDMVGPGDVLGISIYEAGVTLFGNGATSKEAGGFDPTVKVQTLPAIRVDDQGFISIPYAGRLNVLGRTVSEIQDQIRAALRGLSQDPQVIVTQRETINNAVIVSGEVSKPGRLVLQTNRETLTDVVALAGGYRGSAKDLVIRITRRGETTDVRLGDLLAAPAADVRAYPGDRLSLLSMPQTFSVLGASGRAAEVPFDRSRISLMEAVAASGGVNPAYGDPAAIFVFRYTTDENGAVVPVVYHLNMMHPGSYFLGQKFEMQDRDVLYFGNSSSNQPAKMIQLISQLFSPILTITSAVQTVQNGRN